MTPLRASESSKMRGVEVLVGGLLVAGGLFGPVAQTDPAGLPPGEVEGTAELKEVAFAGNTTVEAEDAALWTQGAVQATVETPQLSLTVYEYRKVGGWVAAGGYKVEAGYKTENETQRHAFQNATARIEGDGTGLLYARHNESLRASTFLLSLSQTPPTDLVVSPKSEEMEADDGTYDMLVPSPVIGFGHGESVWRDVDLTNVSFEELRATGGLDVVLENASVTVHHADGTDRYEITPGSDDGRIPSEPGKPVTFAALTIQRGSLSVAFDGTQSTMLTNEPRLSVNGTVKLDAREGQVRAEEETETLRDDTLRVQGNTSLNLEAIGEEDGESRPVSFSLPNQTLGDPTLQGAFRSEADNVTLNGEPVEVSGDPVVRDEVSIIGQIVGALLLIWTVAKKVVPFTAALLSENPLDHPRREEIHDVLERQGVAHMRGIKRLTGIPLGSLSHHLRVLEEAGIVKSVEYSNYRAFFPSSRGLSEVTMERVAPLAHEVRREIGKVLLGRGCETQEAVAERVNRSQGTVSRHIRRLVDAGLVELTDEGNQRYTPTPLLREWLSPD